MGEASNALMQLRPVTFHYKPEYAGGPRTRQYGLIAEEVAAVYPDLVLHDPQTGRPQTVAYHLVNAMLLNEVQKQHRRMLAQEDRIKAQEKIRPWKQQNKGTVEELAALKEQNKSWRPRGAGAGIIGPEAAVPGPDGPGGAGPGNRHPSRRAYRRTRPVENFLKWQVR